MKKILAIIFLLSFSLSAQEKEKGKFFKSIYNELFKYEPESLKGKDFLIK